MQKNPKDDEYSIDAIPAPWTGPRVSPIHTYLIGLRCLIRNCKRTVPHKTSRPSSKRFQEFLFWRKNLIVWTCSCIEAFVNDEGCDCTGISFFKENLERLGTSQKIRVVFALKYRRLIPRTHPVVVAVERLYEVRNGLVHPKTRHARDESGYGVESLAKSALAAPDVFHQVFKLFQENNEE
jgi:hypothetical protein